VTPPEKEFAPQIHNVNNIFTQHCDLAIYIKKYLKAKEEYGNSNISPRKYIIFKKSSKRNQNPSRSYNSVTNLKFQTQAKISSFKNPHIKIDLLPRGQIPKEVIFIQIL
jgi:hypothetical protein